MYRYRITIFLIILFSLLLVTCQGPAGPQGVTGNNSEIERQIRFSVNHTVTFQRFYYDWVILKYMAVRNFNITDYTGVDSAIFIVYMNTAGQNSTLRATLYNLTDSTEITGSQLQTKDSTGTWIESGNILPYLPKKNIDLCLLAKNDYVASDSALALISFYMLILYRNK